MIRLLFGQVLQVLHAHSSFRTCGLRLRHEFAGVLDLLEEDRSLLIESRALGLGFSRDTRKNAPQNSNNSFVVMT